MQSGIFPVKIETANAEARAVLEALKSSIGRIPNLYAVVAHSPSSLRGLLSFEGDLDKQGKLGHREVEDRKSTRLNSSH